MRLSLNQTYPWILHLSDEELTVLQSVLRGDDLDDESERLADRLSGTLDKIRPMAERDRERRDRFREQRDQREPRGKWNGNGNGNIDVDFDRSRFTKRDDAHED